MRRASRIPLSPEGERAFDPSYRHPQCIGDGEDVLVTAARDVDDDDLILTIFACFGGERGQSMGAFERGDDAFGPAAELEGVERLLVGDGDIFDAAALVEPAMFGADAGIIEPGREIGRASCRERVCQYG